MKRINRVVVIGCSGCGALAARTAKELDPSLEVTIIREENEKGLLTRCATPYICCGEVMVEPSYKDDRMFTDRGISLVNVEAVDVEPATQTVTTADGSSYSYDKLVLATGAKPAIPPIPGVDVPGVFTLRTSGDAVGILNWMNSMRVRNALVMGAGAIGIEETYLLSQRGVQVTLVEMLDRVMPRTLDADMSEEVQANMEEKGVVLQLNGRVDAIKGTDRVQRVILSSGEEIDTQMVIVSAGTRCNVELAEKAGLESGTFGLKVNEYLRTSDPDIYAGGDMVEYPSHVTGKPILGQLRPNAVIAGRVIAKNILGYKIQYPPLINSFATKFFDKTIAAAGVTESEAQKEGIEVISAKQMSASKHSMMRERKPYTVKLIFDRKSEKLIGGQIVSDSECPVKSIDVIALAIRTGLGVLDLTTLRCAGQPELSPDPGMEPIALAAESVFKELHKR